VLVSAAIADGPPRRVLEAIAEGEHQLVLAEPAIAEFRRVMVEKIGAPAEVVERLVGLLEEIEGPAAAVPETVEALSGDADDDRIVAAALAAEADLLASGDTKHLLPLGKVGSLRIVRPAELLAELGV
jgi:predicted nucleic acid-binding protein